MGSTLTARMAGTRLARKEASEFRRESSEKDAHHDSSASSLSMTPVICRQRCVSSSMAFNPSLVTE